MCGEGEAVFTIDQRSSTPIYLQLVQGVKEAVLTGVLRPGDRLPSVRELAVQLMINPNTVQKSYRELERQGIIENVQGKGTYVRADHRPRADTRQRSRLREDLRALLIEAHYMGLTSTEIGEMLAELRRELKLGEGDQ